MSTLEFDVKMTNALNLIQFLVTVIGTMFYLVYSFVCKLVEISRSNILSLIIFAWLQVANSSTLIKVNIGII